jgi:RimJ/RimL family protein N-acetyltransferase
MIMVNHSSARVSKPALRFRPLARADLPLLHEWLKRPHVAEWWDDQRDLESILRTFGDSAMIRMYLVCMDQEPIGYIQAYRLMGGDPAWWTEETDPGARGIDQFLANAEQLGQGLGSSMVRQFVESLFADPAVAVVQADPSLRNRRAIRAYEKAGFRRVRQVVTPDGPAVLMRVRRAELG